MSDKHVPGEDEPSSEEPTPDQEAFAPASSRYVIEGSVGSGGMGQVFRAWDQHLGRRVAIKRISNEAGLDEAIRREAGILAALHHPNIVTIFDFAADEIGPFVVMELVDGRDLDQIAEHNPLPVPAFLELVNQVCRGLSSAHAAGLLHLDLKPGNIMLQSHQDGSFTAKILDFGLARAREESTDPYTDEIFASPYTAPPEQLTRQPIDVRSDIYSLGCIFYYALSGRNAFEAPTVIDVLQRHLTGNTTPLYLIAPKVPRTMSDVIARMIQVDPEARPQSVEQARTELHKASRAPIPTAKVASGVYRSSTPEQPGRNVPLATRAATSTAGSSGKRWLIALFVLAGACAGAWWMLGSNRPGFTTGIASAPNIGALATPPLQPIIDPADTTAFASHDGEIVTMEGTVASVEESSLFHAMLLKFTGVPANGVVVSVSKNLADAGRLQAMVGKRLRVTGKCTRSAAMNRVVVESAADIRESGR